MIRARIVDEDVSHASAKKLRGNAGPDVVGVGVGGEGVGGVAERPRGASLFLECGLDVELEGVVAGARDGGHFSVVSVSHFSFLLSRSQSFDVVVCD